MSQTLSGNLSGQIADMLEGSIAGNISLISPSANIESKTITENGTYTAPSGVDGYNPITVNVPNFVRVLNQDETVELKVLPSGETYVYFNNFVLTYGISGFDVLNLSILETILSNFKRNEAWTAQNYTHDGVQTDGHIGIYDNSIRAWSQDYSSNVGGLTFNAVLELSTESGNQNIPYNSIH